MNISPKEKEFIKKAIEYYSNREGKVANCNLLLDEWAQNKKDIYSLFGDNLILEFDLEDFLIQTNFKRDLLDDIRLSLYHSGINLKYLSDESLINNLFYEDVYESESDNKLCYVPIENGTLVDKKRKRKGFKITKENWSWCPKEEYQRFLQKIKLKGKVCFSIHPIDFLTMSNNASGWTTCYSLGECKQGATLSLMTDSCSFLVYIKSENSKITFPFSDLTWNNKIVRGLVHLFKDTLVLPLTYPFEHTGLIEGTVLKLKQMLEKEIKPNCFNDNFGTCLVNAGDYEIDKMQTYDIETLESNKEINIIGSNFTCPFCGKKQVTDIASFGCDNCFSIQYCLGCGQDLKGIDSSQFAISQNSNGEGFSFLCKDCYDSLLKETGGYGSWTLISQKN